MIKLAAVSALALAVLLPGEAGAYSTAGGAGAAPIKARRSILHPLDCRDTMHASRCHRAKPYASCAHRPPPVDRPYGR